MKSQNSFNSESKLAINGKNYVFYDLKVLSKKFNFNLDKIPFSTKILLENLIRNEDGEIITKQMIEKFCTSFNSNKNDFEISFHPTRVLMQDFTGVPAIADLAAMRTALKEININPNKINPSTRVDLVIDHSVTVDYFGNEKAYKENVNKEFIRNKERYEFLKWGQKSFNNFYLVPPGAGICHQVNLENISKTVWSKTHDGETYLYPDSLVGTDSHTTMVNALSVLGWGVGGIEAEAVMLGLPISMNLPQVVGFKINGKLAEGITATDLVLNITSLLRNHGVVGKFVEFYGNGLSNLTLADRATISNMAPEYGATCGFFPTDNETINYLKLTGKTENQIKIVQEYANQQSLWFDNLKTPVYDENIDLDLSLIKASVAGPKRPQDKILLKNVPESFKSIDESKIVEKRIPGQITTGDIVIAAITSCTNTSNPNVMVAAGLVAKKAIEKGLKVKPWVKTSLAPGSKVVSDYLDKSGLSKYLNQIGFNVVGYGCTTCIGNSGPLKNSISDQIKNKKLSVCSVLSGNRNFEGRVHQDVKANYLASPPLVVIYALTGTIDIDIENSAIGISADGKEIYLKDIWPSSNEIQKIINDSLSSQMFTKRYKEIYEGDENWQSIRSNDETTYNWGNSSTYIKNPPFFNDLEIQKNKNIINARIIAMLGNSITTDHISPAGSIKPESPAGKYLSERQVSVENFNSYGSRRGNHEIMMRGTFGNIRIVNEILSGEEGGKTKSFLSNKKMSIYDAAIEYSKQNIPLVVIAGKEYGTGSSRDWAAKGVKLLGIKAVIAESFERIHRSNLIGMGVLPLEFKDNQNRKTLSLDGSEIISISELNNLNPSKDINCKIKFTNETKIIKLKCRIDTKKELEYYNAGGILQYVLNSIIKKSS